MTRWLHDVAAGSDTGDLACATDWAATPLGPPDTWPAGLRAAVEICFTTRFAVLVTWGPELTMIYNDGYRPMLGSDLHPRAMGAPAAELWGGVWNEIGPLFETVMRSGQPTWDEDFPLLMNRSGYPEETTFTFSYSPLRDETGTVRGVLDIATETTEHVVDSRRLQTLHALSTTMHQHGTEALESLAKAAVDVLAGSADVGGVSIHVGELLIAGIPGHDEEATSAARDFVRRFAAPQRVGYTAVHPLSTTGDNRLVGSVTITGNERRPFDAGQWEFLALLARTTGTALVRADALQRELTRALSVGNALQDAMAPTPLASPRWQTRYRPADRRLSVGGDWFDVVEREDGTSALVVGDCVGQGLDAATRMGRLSSAGSAALHNATTPARTLTILDRYAASLAGAEYATVFCGVVDPAARTLVYSSAGHPPALLVRPDGTFRWLDEARGMPLTLGGERAEAQIGLGPGDTVILYTDGLVERRDESLVAGLERLAAAAVPICSGPVETIPDRLLAVLLPDGAHDDVAIVAYRA
ncbi:SpoIIE family protein phosphatase [Paraoerskovia marina]|uniref:SpoIIE family protein phosphatase n=1 Tax=Paraoerskovia marina TaxID=545619 RepID=UPI0004928FB7|nr:SpoIIE family protein phosphatase [Paraoerskovia marina]